MIRFRFTPILIVAAVVFAIAGPAAAEEPIGPDPALAPEKVVAIQLAALKHNDFPHPNAGIAQTFALAHPSNKRITGPLPRFEQMIRSPAYRPLLNHTAHEIERVGGTDTLVQFRVVIETTRGDAFEYFWEVGRVTDGPDEGAWLTISVSPPADAGKSL